MKHTLRIAAVIAAIALVFVACDNPASSDSGQFTGPKAQVSGLVIDYLTGEALVDVDVTLTGEDGSWTVKSDERGIFFFENVIPGRYTAVYKLPGYDTAYIGNNPTTDLFRNYTTAIAGNTNYIEVKADQYWQDDPYAEYDLITKELAALAAGGGLTDVSVTIDGTSGTFDSGTNSFKFEVDRIRLDAGGYTYNLTLGIQALAPLSVGVQGTLHAVFASADDTLALERAAKAGAAGANIYFVKSAIGTADPENEDLGTIERVYGPVTTGADGTFSQANVLPAGIEISGIFVDSFNQANADGTTYYFKGFVNRWEADDVDDGDQVWDITQTYTGGNYPLDDLYIFPNKGDLFVEAHNIGSSKARLEVNAPIVVTFDKPVAPDSLTAFVDTPNASGVYNDSYNHDSANSTPSLRTFDIRLRAEWSADNTTVTLYADDRPSDGAATPAEAALKALPFGPANGSQAGQLVIESKIRGADGSRLRGYVPLPVYTVEKIKLTDVVFGERKDLPTSYSREYTDTTANGQVPTGGTVTLTFTKPIALNSAQFVLYKSTDNGVGAAWDNGTTIRQFNISGNTVDIWLDEVALASTLYAIGYSVSSTGPNDTITKLDADDTDIVNFVTKDTVTLLETNLYAGDTNVYYVGTEPSNDLYSFPVDGAIELTFEGVFEAAGVKAELYRTDSLTSNGDLYDNPTGLKRASIPLNAPAVTTDAGITTLSIKPTEDLAFGEEYSLALRIVSTDGYTIFNSQSPAFAYYYATSGGAPAVSTNSLKLVYVEFSDTTNVTPDYTNGNIYISFSTEEDSTVFVGIDDYLSRSNIKADGSTDDFDPKAPIKLAFKEGFEPVTVSADLYVWIDADTDDTVTLTELTPSQLIADGGIVVSGSTVTLYPAGILAPGQSFAIRLIAENAAGKKAIYDTAQGGSAEPHLTFTVDDTLSVAQLLELADDPAVVAIGGFAGNGPVNSDAVGSGDNTTPVNVRWTALNKSLTSPYYGETIYNFYSEDSLFGWRSAGDADEVARDLGLGRDATLTTTAYVPGYGADTSVFAGGDSVSLRVTGVNEYGFFAASPAIVARDTVGPLLDNLSIGSVGNVVGSTVNYTGEINHTIIAGPSFFDITDDRSIDTLVVSITGRSTDATAARISAEPISSGGYRINFNFGTSAGISGDFLVTVRDLAGNLARITVAGVEEPLANFKVNF